jgi:twitching motility protein PilT
MPPPKAAAQRPAPVVAPQDSYLGKALALALRQGASDLHVHSGAPLLVRIDGQLQPLSGDKLVSADAAEKVIAEITSDAQWAVLGRKGEVDFACELPGRARFRANVYRQQRGLDAVFRIIPVKPPTLEQLRLPARLARLTDFRTGMVLCTGPAGCGKSTTLAALLHALALSRADHILTIEDPVEYVFEGGQALVNQRQIGDHTGSFARALRAALREDPDIIAITELRDRETIALAISAAETGHLVLGTLHTGNAVQTINRMVSSFPADEQEQVRVMLAESLRAVVSQRLLPMAAGRGRVPAVELLMVNTAVSNLIREDKTHQLPSVMQTGKAAGMIMLDDSLHELVTSGVVSRDAAQRVAVKKDRFA